MTRPKLALIHSPLVGPMTWQGVAACLRARGYPCIATPDVRAWEVEPPYYDALAHRAAADLEGGPWLLVAHSGAGGLLPAIAEALPGGAQAMVFVDAIAPHPGRTWLQTAPPALSAMLWERAKHGLAPPWPRWFPEPVLTGLLPDASVRAAFVAQCRAIPMAYLAETAPAAAIATACGYLQLSPGYAVEADAARAAGWAVLSEPVHHLAMVTAPDRVAAALHSLIEDLSVSFES